MKYFFFSRIKGDDVWLIKYIDTLVSIVHFVRHSNNLKITFTYIAHNLLHNFSLMAYIRKKSQLYFAEKSLHGYHLNMYFKYEITFQYVFKMSL